MTGYEKRDHAKTKILTLIAHISESIVAEGFKLGKSIDQSSCKTRGKLAPRSLPVWAWHAIVSTRYEIGLFPHLFKALPFRGRGLLNLQTLDLVSRRVEHACEPRMKPTAACGSEC